jgi:hypothetical protein
MTKEEAHKILCRNILPCLIGEWREAISIATKALEAEPRWIPVTEDTLPEENRVVVVCGNKGTWDFGTYRGHGNNIHYWHWKKNTFKRVYWWMYKEDALPDPYKGVTE